MTEQVARFRDAYRAAEIPAHYVGWGHFAFTMSFGLLGIAWCVWRIDAPTALQWLVVPITLIYANFSEYWGHRTAMHHPVRGLGLIYRRHAGQHHRFFTHAAMPVDDTRDFKAVLFPPLLVTFFLTAFAVPAGWLVGVVAGPNAAYLFVATGLAYFLNYEVLHLAYHAPADSWISRLPGLPVLRRLHQTHHDQSLMTSRNFNITYPLGDFLFGTLHRESADPTVATDPAIVKPALTGKS